MVLPHFPRFSLPNPAREGLENPRVAYICIAFPCPSLARCNEWTRTEEAACTVSES
jgi:hypothetical protein